MTVGPGEEFEENHQELDLPTPLSFKIMVVLVGLYLLYRLGQAVVWLFQALSG